MEIIQSYPRISIVLISLAISFGIVLINFFVMDKDKMRELRSKQKELNVRIKVEKDQKKKMEMSQEMMQHALESMKHSFKPMFITLIPLLLIFWFLKGVYAETGIASNWIWYYIGAAIAGSIIFRKLFRMP